MIRVAIYGLVYPQHNAELVKLSKNVRKSTNGIGYDI